MRIPHPHILSLAMLRHDGIITDQVLLDVAAAEGMPAFVEGARPMRSIAEIQGNIDRAERDLAAKREWKCTGPAAAVERDLEALRRELADRVAADAAGERRAA